MSSLATVHHAQEPLWLTDVRAASVSASGGKGANLARLAQAGFSVPDGFVVTADVLALQQERLRGLVDSIRVDDDPALTSQRLVEGLLSVPAHPVLRDVVCGGYEELIRRTGTAACVAVRSSAACEDGVHASFAGQHDTFLGIRDSEGALAGVMRCLASAWSPRAMDYRRRLGLHETMPRFAVIVQHQVEADVSGVLFTVNPTGVGSGRACAVTASYGLGEMIVSGRVTPDTFIVSRSGKLISRTLGSKDLMVGRSNREEPVPIAQRRVFALEEHDLASLVRIGLAVEELFGGGPQDIEWCLAAGHVAVLQARPITAVFPAKEERPPSLSWSRRVFLTYSPMLVHFEDHFPEPIMASDFTSTVTAALAGIGDALAEIGLRMRDVSAILPTDPTGTIRFEPGPPRPTWRIALLPRAIRRAWRFDAVREWNDVDRPAIDELQRSFEAIDAEAVGTADLGRKLSEMQASFVAMARRRFQKYFLPGLLQGAVLRALLWLARGRAALAERGALHLAIPHATAVMNQEVRCLVQDISVEPAWRAAMTTGATDMVWARIHDVEKLSGLRARLYAFLDRYGSRTARGMIPVPSSPTWREQPSAVIGLVRALLRSTSLSDGRQNDEVAFESSRVTVRAALARSWKGRLGLPGLFDKALGQVRQFVIMREATLQQSEVGVAIGRRLALEIGRRLVGAGVLAELDDAFHLRLDEVEEVLSGVIPASEVRERVAVRKRQYESWRAIAAGGDSWVRHLVGVPQAQRPDPIATDRVIAGLAASPGRRVGTARIIRGQDEFSSLQPGEILVCPATAPAWTPLFGLASAVVTDIGGPLSHAAIVAREYGIPAVLGAAYATQVIQDGQTIAVDGTTGRVELRPD
jgi:pyruvate,water dikinase